MSTGFDPISFLQLFSSASPPSINVLTGNGTNTTINGDPTAATDPFVTSLGNPATQNDLFVGTTADETFDGGTSSASGSIAGANIYYGGGGVNNYLVGTDSNDIVVIDSASTGAANENVIMQGVNAGNVATTITAHGRVDTTDYRIDYSNGTSTYIVDAFDANGNPRNEVFYEDGTTPFTMDYNTLYNGTGTNPGTGTGTGTGTGSGVVNNNTNNINNESASTSNAQIFQGGGWNWWPFGNSPFVSINTAQSTSTGGNNSSSTAG